MLWILLGFVIFLLPLEFALFFLICREWWQEP